MASTEQIRKWFHSGVVLNHADRGTSGYHPHCDHDHPKVAFPRAGGGVFNEPVHPLTFEAFTAYVAVMRHHGETMPGAGGVDQCRNIGTGNWPSLHAYICAVDLPPNSRKSAAFITSIKAIRTNSDAQVFRNLSGDRMHDQINCSPADLATGVDWTTVIGATMSDHPATSHRAFTKHHNTGTVPSWAPWKAYQQAGGSSIESSGPWSFTRADAAWYWKKWIVPLQKRATKLEAEIVILRKRIVNLETAPPTGVSEARVKELIAASKIVPN